MLHTTHLSTPELSTRVHLDELGKILHARKLSLVLADAATQGHFSCSLVQHPLVRNALQASLVAHSMEGLQTLFKLDKNSLVGQSSEQLAPTIGVQMARNALEATSTQLAIALTLCPSKHLALPQCTVLGLHWWYQDKNNEQSSWMLSQQFVTTVSREELPFKLVQLALQESIKVLRLHDATNADTANAS